MPTILKGFHRPLLPHIGIYKDKRSLHYRVKFTNSCRYFIGEDQNDTNKLFGIGYFPNHHRESARFGWHYDMATGTGRGGNIVLSAYCYVNGERVIKDICTIPVVSTVELYLNISTHAYQFFVFDNTGKLIGSKDVSRFTPKRWGYPLWFYFGGNKVAPHSVTVKMKKL